MAEDEIVVDPLPPSVLQQKAMYARLIAALADTYGLKADRYAGGVEADCPRTAFLRVKIRNGTWIDIEFTPWATQHNDLWSVYLTLNGRSNHGYRLDYGVARDTAHDSIAGYVHALHDVVSSASNIR